MKTRKKIVNIISLVIAILMIATATVGCSNNQQNNNNAESSTEENNNNQQSNNNAESSTEENNNNQQNNTETEETNFEENLELTWVVTNLPGMIPEKDTEVEKLIEEKFNVSIEVMQVDITNEEQWNLFWAEGNTPDVITTYHHPYYPKLVSQNIVRDIPEDLFRKNLETWMSNIYSFMDKELVDELIKYGGNIYGIPIGAVTSGYHYMARKDWMDAVGISKMPETIDEYHNMLKKFTYEDPDQNGENDTYGMHGGHWLIGFGMVFGAYDSAIPYNAYDVRDGKVINLNTTEGYKQALKTINQWYDEGLIDPEFVTDDRDVYFKKWEDGKFGSITESVWWLQPNTATNLRARLLEKNPDAEFDIIWPIEGPEGHSGAFCWHPASTIYAHNTMFGKNTSDEKIKRVMAIKESFASDIDWYLRCTYGIEGETYDIEEGIVVANTEMLTSEYKTEKGLGYFSIMQLPIEKKYSQEQMKIIDKATDVPKAYGGERFVVSKENTAKSEKGADVNTVISEFYYNAITGQVDIDAEWDSYLNMLDEAGLQDIISEYQEMYDSTK